MTSNSTSTSVPRDEQIIALLCAGRSATEAAAEIGVSVSTIYRRLRSPAFSQRLIAAQAMQFRPQIERLCSEFDRSLAVMVELRDGARSEAVRLRAAGEIVTLILDTTGRRVDQAYRDALTHLIDAQEARNRGDETDESE